MKKEDKLVKWAGTILVGLAFVGGLYLSVYGTTVVVQASWNFPTQKIIYTQEADGLLIFQDTITDGSQSVNLSTTGRDDSLNIWHFRLWEDTTGLPWSFLYYRDLNASADASESWNVDTLYLPDTADTVKRLLLRDGTTINTRTYTNVAAIPETTYTVASGTFSEVLYQIKYDATDTFSTFNLAYDLLGDSVSGGGIPSTGHACRVTVVVKTFQELPDSGRTITVYPVRNFVKDSTGQVITMQPIKSTTNALGQASFDLMWSNYFIPPLNYVYVMVTPYGSLRKIDSVPSTTTYTFSLIR